MIASNRSGGVVKVILIGIVVLIAIAGGTLFYAHRKVTTAAAKPLDIPDVASREDVQSSIKRRLSKVEPPAPAGAPKPAAPTYDTLTVTADELTALILRLMPPVDGLKLGVAIVDGNADLRLSLPSKEFLRMMGPQLGGAKGYIESNIAWVNLDVRLDITFADGKLAMKVKQVRQPDYLPADQVQAALDGFTKSMPQGPLICKDGDFPFELASFELAGDAAVMKVRRINP